MWENYLKNTEKWDKPSFYWPILTLYWIVMFLFYIWSNNILSFYAGVFGSIGYLTGIRYRNFLRKKKLSS